MYSVLEGIKVLDLTNVLAGPFCTYNLAMLGAEIIKIEKPNEGDLARRLGAKVEFNRRLMGSSFLAQNANKKSITLNLKKSKDKEEFLKLVPKADVIVENFRPGVVKSLGIDYETVKKINSRIIYCSISGFGQSGPMAHRPAYDQIIQGISGLMSVNGDDTLNPLRCGFPICDTVGGLTAAFSIASAIVKRFKSNKGTYIDISMLDATLPMLGWVVSNYLVADIKPRPMGNENFTSAPSGTFYAADGPFNLAANEEKQWKRLCLAIHRDDLLRDKRFKTRDNRKRHRAELNKILNTEFKKHKADYWVNKMTELGIPCGEILKLEELLESEVAKHRELISTYYIPSLSTNVRILNIAPKFSGIEKLKPSPPPELGEHNMEVLDAIKEQ